MDRRYKHLNGEGRDLQCAEEEAEAGGDVGQGGGPGPGVPNRPIRLKSTRLRIRAHTTSIVGIGNVKHGKSNLHRSSSPEGDGESDQAAAGVTIASPAIWTQRPGVWYERWRGRH